MVSPFESTLCSTTSLHSAWSLFLLRKKMILTAARKMRIMDGIKTLDFILVVEIIR